MSSKSSSTPRQGFMHRVTEAGAELAGTAAGWVAAPLFGAAALARQARVFHPVGVVCAGAVRMLDGDGADMLPDLAGPALVRFSAALFRSERLDTLGCSLRIGVGTQTPGALPAASDQDLLFATTPRAWLLPLSPLLTNQRSYLDNAYYALGWFEARGRPVELRLAPTRWHGAHGGTRVARLLEAVRRGRGDLVLEVRPYGGGRWQAGAMIEVRERAFVDGSALRFDPFQAGRGLRARGFLHALRKGPYRLSQAVRAAVGPEPAPGGTARPWLRDAMAAASAASRGDRFAPGEAPGVARHTGAARRQPPREPRGEPTRDPLTGGGAGGGAA